MADDDASASAHGEALAKLATALVSLGAVWLACDPDGPARLVYRVRLWLAYRQSINYDRLRGVRQRLDAGALRDDVTPTTTTIREVLGA